MLCYKGERGGGYQMKFSWSKRVSWVFVIVRENFHHRVGSFAIRDTVEERTRLGLFC